MFLITDSLGLGIIRHAFTLMQSSTSDGAKHFSNVTHSTVLQHLLDTVNFLDSLLKVRPVCGIVMIIGISAPKECVAELI